MTEKNKSAIITVEECNKHLGVNEHCCVSSESHVKPNGVTNTTNTTEKATTSTTTTTTQSPPTSNTVVTDTTTKQEETPVSTVTKTCDNTPSLGQIMSVSITKGVVFVTVMNVRKYSSAVLWTNAYMIKSTPADVAWLCKSLTRTCSKYDVDEMVIYTQPYVDSAVLSTQMRFMETGMICGMVMKNVVPRLVSQIMLQKTLSININDMTSVTKLAQLEVNQTLTLGRDITLTNQVATAIILAQYWRNKVVEILSYNHTQHDSDQQTAESTW